MESKEQNKILNSALSNDPYRDMYDRKIEI